MEAAERIRKAISDHWNKNWFALLVIVILLAVLLSGYLSAQHATRMAGRYYERIDAIEKKIDEKVSQIEKSDREAEAKRAELEKRLAVSMAKWDSSMRRYSELRASVTPGKPKDDKELIERFSALGYKAVLK